VLSLGMLVEQSVKLWQAQTARGKVFSDVVATMRHPTDRERGRFGASSPMPRRYPGRRRLGTPRRSAVRT